MDLSVIIVSYNTQDLTLQAINSVVKAKQPKNKLEIILIDNNSSDNTVSLVKTKFPKVKIIANSKNLGFAKANNQGLRKAKGRYLLLLNSDVIINKDTLIKMIDYMDNNQQIGLSTCRVELADGSIDPASHRGFPTPWASFTYYSGLEKLFPSSKIFAQYHQGWKDLTKTHQIDSPVGAFYLLNKKALQQVGFFDESFFMYGEDLDLAYRLKKTNWQVIYNPITKITHLKSSSGLKKGKGGRLTSEDKQQRIITSKHFFKAMKIFYKKHYFKKYFLFYFPVLLAINLFQFIKIIKIKLS